MQLNQIPIFEELKDANNILIAGAGGGFDIYSGVPMYFALKKMGKNVSLANLSFTMLPATTAELIFPHCYKVQAKDEDHSRFYYFPEQCLAEWLSTEGEEIPIYAFEKTGIQPLKESYNYLIDQLNIDAVILVDGGTDSLMFGDEYELGTPVEDICSMGAVFQSNIVKHYLLCLGFGVDHYHGVSHYRFLENLSTIAQKGGYLGAMHLLPQMEESQKLIQAVDFANKKMSHHQSIVANSIVSTLEGHYGDHHRTQRTSGSELWVNPMMSIYWAFHLKTIIEHNKYYEFVKDTQLMGQIHGRINTFRNALSKVREYKQIPI